MSEVTAEMIERGQGLDPQGAARQRRMSSHLRAARERLTTSDTGLRGADIALLRAYADMRAGALPAASALIVAAALLALYFAPPPRVLLWLAAAFATLFLAREAASRLRRLDDAKVDVTLWRRRFVSTELGHALAWAGLAALLPGAGASGASSFVVVALLLASAYNSMVTATAPALVCATLAPGSAVALSFTLSAGQAGGDGRLALFLLVTAAPVVLFVLARRFHELASESLFFRAEKNELIARLEQVNAASDEARRRAEDANLAKSRFLATMSHELRTPLNAILGFSEVLESELYGAHAVPAYRDYARDIRASGHHLLTLINEILDLSRVEAGRYELKEESVSLVGVAQDCRHLLALRAQKRDIELIEIVEPALPRIWADERAIRQIVLNLLTNAIKFTPQGGRVTLKVGWTGVGGQYLSIRDNGPGIPQEEIAVVMSPFGRGALAQKNAEEGSGLGLPIVKGLVELHGGRFVLKTKSREGTEAIVVLPPQRVMTALPKLGSQRPAA
jgi:two-component system cell cycle sensor histidine kinase PleC